MVETTERVFQGPWRRLINSSAASAGSIHDDEAARRAGFEGGFVPGSVVGTNALSAVFDRYGARWMEGGWYSLTFVSPVYEHNDVRAVGAPLSGREELSVRVETREGRLCCSGHAGLGDRLPWDPAQDGARGANEVLPGIPLGLAYDEIEFTPTAEDQRSMLEAAGDHSAWYREASPWGGPVVAPERLMVVALRMRPPRTFTYGGARQPGMWYKHELLLHRPLPLGVPYRVSNRIADKGRSGRAVFVVYEFCVRDADGAEVALGRHGVKWLAAESPPAPAGV
jgi:hypothetical protein